MKKILNIIAISVLIAVGCKEQDDSYRQYTVPGSIVYPGKALSPTVHSGFGRLKISWLQSANRSVTTAQISWNNFSSDTTVSVSPDMDTVRVILALKEGSYSFVIKTYDANGNVSVPVEVNGKVYGNAYLSSVYPRGVRSVSTRGAGHVAIEWADINAGSKQYDEITYTAIGSVEKTVISSEAVTNIQDFLAGSTLKYRTAYLPDTTAMDFAFSPYVELPGYFKFDKVYAGASVIDYSSQVNTAAANVAVNATDGVYTNRWHSANVAYPHYITVDLNVEIMISRFGVWPSTADMPAGEGDIRAPDRVRFEVSMDNATWTTLGEFDYDNSTALGERIFDVTPATARYCKLTGLSGATGNNYMVIAELDVYCR